jgi:hypothetical protein
MTEEAKRLCDVPSCHQYVYVSKWREHHDLLHQPEHPEKHVMYYSDHFQSLNNDLQKKALEFIKYHCLKYTGDGIYVCKPLPKNHRVHVLKKDETGEFTCTCQHWTTYQTICSHIAALYRFFAMRQRYDAPEPEEGRRKA